MTCLFSGHSQPRASRENRSSGGGRHSVCGKNDRYLQVKFAGTFLISDARDSGICASVSRGRALVEDHPTPFAPHVAFGGLSEELTSYFERRGQAKSGMNTGYVKGGQPVVNPWRQTRPASARSAVPPVDASERGSSTSRSGRWLPTSCTYERPRTENLRLS